MVKTRIITRRPQSTGTTSTISLPKRWLRVNKINLKEVEELIMIEGESLIIINPNNPIYGLIKRIAHEGITLEQLERIIKGEVVF